MVYAQSNPCFTGQSRVYPFFLDTEIVRLPASHLLHIRWRSPMVKGASRMSSAQRRFRRRGVSVIPGGGDGLRRTGLASVVAVCLLAVGALAAQPALGDQGSSSGGCVTKQGP